MCLHLSSSPLPGPNSLCPRWCPDTAAVRSHLSRLQVVQDTKGQVDQRNDELLSSFNVATFKSDEDDAAFWNRLIPQVHGLPHVGTLSGLQLSLPAAAVCLVLNTWSFVPCAVLPVCQLKIPTVAQTACASSLASQVLHSFCWPAHLLPPGMVQDERAEDEGLDVYRELGPRTARTRGGGGAGEVCRV